MKCGRVRDLFSAYLESATDGNLAAKMDEHMAGCDSCREAYERFNATVMMLDEIPEVDPPADFHAAVMARVERARRTVPQPVRWWTIDWQHVFTIRVPARAATVGIAVVLLLTLALQLFPPLKAGVANIFGLQKPSSTPISHVDEDAPRPWLPWNSEPRSDSGLLMSIARDSARAYSIRFGTKSSKEVAFEVNAGGTKYRGSVVANRNSEVRVPAPAKGSVAVVGVTWALDGRGRYELIFLPAELSRQISTRGFKVENVTVEDALRKISRDYRIAVIAWGNLSQTVAYAQVEDATPNEALFCVLEEVGMKYRALGSSVYAVEPAR